MQDTSTIRIVLYDKNNIGIVHCCYRSEEYSKILPIANLYNMSNIEFKQYLDEAYKIIPNNHDYSIQYYCNTNNKICLYNDKQIESIAIDVFTPCNIRCKFCPINHERMPLNTAKELYMHLLYKIRNNNYKTIISTGQGEPFICKNETIEYMKTLTTTDCKEFVFVTNGTLLDEQSIIELSNIKKHSGINIMIIVSCSGITNDSYTKIHNNNNFDKVVKNIQLLDKYDLLQFINFVVMDINLHELEFYKEFWHKNGLINDDKLVVTPVHNIGQDWIINTQEYKKYFNNN